MKRLCAVTALAGLVAVVRVASAATGTHVVVYSPFTVGGQLANGIAITKTIRGDCWTSSSTSARPDAWRCMSGTYIYDPCYSRAVGWVACPRDALGRRVIKFVLVKALGSNVNGTLDTNRAAPSRVVLRTGPSCTFVSGATGAVAGLRLNYACSNGGWLLGEPDRHARTWTILYLPNLKSAAARPVRIATAVF